MGRPQKVNTLLFVECRTILNGGMPVCRSLGRDNSAMIVTRDDGDKGRQLRSCAAYIKEETRP